MNNLEKKNKKILSCNTYHKFIECLKKEFPNGFPNNEIPKEIKEKEQTFYKKTSWYNIQNPIQIRDK